MGYFIGSFKKTDTGYVGNIETLTLKAPAEFTRVLDRKHENAPAFEIFSGDLRIGAAWERKGQNGTYLSVSLDDPSFSAGYYNLYAKRGMDNSYELTFERPRSKKDKGDVSQAA